jgi:hypothetical protein
MIGKAAEISKQAANRWTGKSVLFFYNGAIFIDMRLL